MALKTAATKVCPNALRDRSIHQSHNRNAWLSLSLSLSLSEKKKRKRIAFGKETVCTFLPLTLRKKGKTAHFGNPLGGPPHTRTTDVVNYVDSTFPLASALRGHLTQEQHISYDKANGHLVQQANGRQSNSRHSFTPTHHNSQSQDIQVGGRGGGQGGRERTRGNIKQMHARNSQVMTAVE